MSCGSAPLQSSQSTRVSLHQTATASNLCLFNGDKLSCQSSHCEMSIDCTPLILNSTCFGADVKPGMIGISREHLSQHSWAVTWNSWYVPAHHDMSFRQMTLKLTGFSRMCVSCWQPSTVMIHTARGRSTTWLITLTNRETKRLQNALSSSCLTKTSELSTCVVASNAQFFYLRSSTSFTCSPMTESHKVYIYVSIIFIFDLFFDHQ